MSNVINNQMADSPYLKRRILTYAEVIRREFPNVQVVVRGKTYNDIEFRDPADAAVCTQAVLDPLVIKCTIIEWIKIMFTECNNLQEYVSSFYSFSAMGMNQTQLSMYEQKHAKSKEYLYDIQTYMNTNTSTLEEAIANVLVPTMILNEANVTGDAPYDLSRAIVQNYLDSNEAMTAYFGLLEGERRLAKRRVAACTSISELQNVQWANWPEFVPPQENIGD